ncbi:MAG: proprotein convertase P-domain-containing protein [Acidobacteriota bacterium]
MRVNSNNSSAFENIANPEATRDSQVVDQLQSSVTSGNVSATLRQAETNIGTNQQSGRLRSNESVSLKDIFRNINGALRGRSTPGADQLAANTVTGNATPNAAIRDLQTTTSTINLAEAGQVDKLKVNVNIGHTYRGDLVVRLTSPTGKTATLHNRTGGSADNLVFEVDRSEFAGEPITGNWRLTVQDTARRDEGILRSWGLTITKRVGGQPPQSGPTNLQVIGDAAFRQRVAADLAKFAPNTTVDAQGYVHEATNRTSGHDQGYTLINQLLNNPNKVNIQFTPDNAFTQSGAGATGTPTAPGRGSSASVSYDPDLNIALPTLQPNGTIRDQAISSEVVLAHELVHALHAQRGTIDRSNRDHFFTDGNQRYKETWRFEEFRTTGFAGFRQGLEPSENSIRAELGFNPRATYLGRESWSSINGVTAGQRAVNATGQSNIVGDVWKSGNGCLSGCCIRITESASLS